MRFQPLLMPFLALLASATGAQQVTRVYPRFAIAGQETRFTAEGRDFPASAPAALGMKFVTTPTPCTAPRRTQPVTTSHYRFACTFAGGADTATLKIFVKDRKREGPALWQDRIQLLAGPPLVTQVFVRGASPEGATVVTCSSVTSCLFVQGPLGAGQALQVEVSGSNLPQTLRLDIDACERTSTLSNEASTTQRMFTCTAGQAPTAALRVLSARTDEGGAPLFNAMISLAVQTPAVNAPPGAAAPTASSP